MVQTKEDMRNDVLQLVTQGTRKKKCRVIPTGVEAMTFWLLVQMLSSNQKVIGLTPVGRTRNFFFRVACVTN